MIILPAIDIKGGTCVRLFKGDMDTAEKVAEDPVETALAFRNAGAEWIHMVDLDGAVAGERINTDIFVTVAGESGLKTEVGGGIRTMQDVQYYLNHGIERVILGSIALKDPQFVREAVKEYGARIVVGIDARDGKVAAEGWVQDSSVDYIELARRMEDAGVKCIIFTDILRDGTLSGPNHAQLNALNGAVQCDVIASGGISNINDIQRLHEDKLYGAICGKSIYKGTLNLAQAIQTCTCTAEVL